MHIWIHVAHLPFPELYTVHIQWKKRNASRCLPKGCLGKPLFFRTEVICLFYGNLLLLVVSSGTWLCSKHKGQESYPWCLWSVIQPLVPLKGLVLQSVTDGVTWSATNNAFSLQIINFLLAGGKLNLWNMDIRNKVDLSQCANFSPWSPGRSDRVLCVLPAMVLGWMRQEATYWEVKNSNICGKTRLWHPARNKSILGICLPSSCWSALFFSMWGGVCWIAWAIYL